jgi:hypothetical protein
MSTDVQVVLNQAWERYEIPESPLSAEFPAEPSGDVEVDETGIETVMLSYNQGEDDKDDLDFRLDLALTEGQVFEMASSEAFAKQLEEDLKDEEDLELLSVTPRSYNEFPGVVQRMRLRESGESLVQWVIATPDETVFAGITFVDERFAIIADRFFDSVVISDE